MRPCNEPDTLFLSDVPNINHCVPPAGNDCIVVDELERENPICMS